MCVGEKIISLDFATSLFLRYEPLMMFLIYLPLTTFIWRAIISVIFFPDPRTENGDDGHLYSLYINICILYLLSTFKSFTNRRDFIAYFTFTQPYIWRKFKLLHRRCYNMHITVNVLCADKLCCGKHIVPTTLRLPTLQCVRAAHTSQTNQLKISRRNRQAHLQLDLHCEHYNFEMI